MKLPNLVKKPKIEYSHTSDETVSVHASSFLPRPKEINPLAHQTVNKAIEVSKRSNDMLGTKPKKPNTMLMLAILAIAIVVVAYVIYDDQQKQAVPAGAQNTTPGQQSAAPPKPSDILPIPLPGFS